MRSSSYIKQLIRESDPAVVAKVMSQLPSELQQDVQELIKPKKRHHSLNGKCITIKEGTVCQNQ
jgi:hypothetical protein